MPKRVVKSVFSSALLFLSLCAGAQKLPSLKAAPEIGTFALPCGLNCYVVTCKAETSRADFALIQTGPSALRSTEMHLDSLPHFAPHRPELFMKANGIIFNSTKYPFNEDESTVFRLNGVDVGVGAAVDTSLLMLFDLASFCPYTQAIVVSGDIAPASMSDKIKSISMMLSKREALPRREETAFVHKGFPEPVVTAVDGGENVSMTFSAARAPRQVMSTVQPALTRMFFSELSAILEQRLKAALRREGLYFSDVRFSYTDSSQSALDETYSIGVGTGAQCGAQVARVMANVIASVAEGIGEEEFREARERVLMEEKVAIAMSSQTNSDYIRRCASNFLFASSLAPRSAENDYFAARPLPLGTECGIFNTFIEALFEGCPASDGTVREICAMGDTLSLPKLSDKKKDALKISQESSEPVSGGKLWTFSNGMRVIYKKVPTAGVFQYSLMLRGGCGEVPGFKRGEMAFVPDMLRLSRVSGMSAERFRGMLEANAVTMDVSASVSDLRICGTAVKEKFPLLLKSLVGLALERETDTLAVSRYMVEEGLRLNESRGSQAALEARMDSLLRPDYNYLIFKDNANLSRDLPERAQRYFSSQFSKFNDGVMVIFGDLDESFVRRQLCRYLFSLNVSRSFSVRPLISYSQKSGCTTYTESSASSGGRYDREGMFIAMGSFCDMSVTGYMAVQMAAYALENKLRLSLGRAGYHVSVHTDCEFFPLERTGVFVSVVPGRGAGMDPLSIVPTVRGELSDIARSGVSDAELKTLKTYFTKDYESRLSRPGQLMEMTLARYSDGKDLVSDYKSRIAAVTGSDINSILSRWDTGGKIEYIVSR